MKKSFFLLIALLYALLIKAQEVITTNDTLLSNITNTSIDDSLTLLDSTVILNSSIYYDTVPNMDLSPKTNGAYSKSDFSIDTASLLPLDSIPADSELVVHPPMSDEEFEKILNPIQYKEKTEQPNRILFAVKVVDSRTNEPITAYVELIARTKGGKMFNGGGYCNDKGIFKLNLIADSRVKVKISFGTYMPVTDFFNLIELYEVDGKEEVKKMYKLDNIVKDEYYVLEHINFKQNQYKLEQESFRELDDLVTLMENNPKMTIEIGGHTDDTGSEDASKRLSEDRVESVKNYLVDKGIKSRRIKGEGFGSSKPRVKGNDPEARKKNRRVEFKVLKL